MSTPTRKLKSASNLSDVASAATSRTNLGGTTVGANFFTLSNPSAVRFPKINADNSVTARTAAEMISDLGAAPALELLAENPSSPTPPSAPGTNSVAIGDSGYASRNGEIALGHGSQYSGQSFIELRASTTDATQTEMLADGSGYLTIPRGSGVVGICGRIISMRHDVGVLYAVDSCYDWRFDALIACKSGSGSDVQVVGDIEISPRTGISSSYSVEIDVVSASADTRLRIRVTGAASENVNWTAHCKIDQQTV